MKPSTGDAVRLHWNALRDRPDSLSAFKWNACPPSPESADCDRAQDFVTRLGVSFRKENTPGQPVALSIGPTEVEGWDAAKWQAAFDAAGYPRAADPDKVNWLMAERILVVMLVYVTMVYGPIAAFLVELFPTKIRYTSMSLPYHIGNG